MGMQAVISPSQEIFVSGNGGGNEKDKMIEEKGRGVNKRRVRTKLTESLSYPGHTPQDIEFTPCK